MTRKTRNPGSHPAERFVAPSSIQSGVPLSHLLGGQAVELLAESMAAVMPTFDVQRFRRVALKGIDELGLMERAAHLADTLTEELPTHFPAAAQIIVKSLGPELTATEGNGLAPFFYLPHSQWISRQTAADLDQSLSICYELTKRFTAEFCIRPFLIEHQDETLLRLSSWATDSNPHVRRLVSEGTRPRLPWGMRLKAFQADPRPVLELLELLKDDPVPYVYRSVANHLGDILKDNLDTGFATCERWLQEVARQGVDPQRVKTRHWIIRHAVRNPAKQGDSRALRLRVAAK